MRKIKNPYNRYDGYNCFGCSPSNPSGLKMEFYEEQQYIISKWTPGSDFQGYFDTLHGGIQATIIDELASWVVYVKAKTSGVTSKLNVRYLKPILVSEGEIEIRGKIINTMRNLCNIEVEIFNSKGEKCTHGEVLYFLFSQEKAKKEFYYPEEKDFYE